MDDEFIDDINIDEASENDDDGDDDIASGDDSQPDVPDGAEDSISDDEVGGNDNSFPVGRMDLAPVSREREFPFIGDTGVKVVLENPQDPVEIF